MTRRIVITLGDVNGVGPEIALKAAHELRDQAQFVLLGDQRVLNTAARQLAIPVPIPYKRDQQQSGVYVYDGGCAFPLSPGIINVEASKAAFAWLNTAIEGCLCGEYNALVTAPICKEGMHKAGINIPGHTEYLAQKTGCKRFAMMLMGGPLRVVLATRHVPLKSVAQNLSVASLVETMKLLHESLPWLGCPDARIGICALNPHAGDGGILGEEEDTIIRPAIASVGTQGIHVNGPIPADVIFHQAWHRKWDAIVAMYHDQGLGPLKMIAFDSGINVTLGLPIIRTSPDHGTAFDIAGKGIANHASMRAACELALELCERPNPWK